MSFPSASFSHEYDNYTLYENVPNSPANSFIIPQVSVKALTPVKVITYHYKNKKKL